MPFVPTPEQALLLRHNPNAHGVLLAGPGTGKSATMVAYIEQLAASDEPPRVRLLTFTRAATAELALKVSQHPTLAAERPSTIHSFAISVLTRNARETSTCFASSWQREVDPSERQQLVSRLLRCRHKQRSLDVC